MFCWWNISDAHRHTWNVSFGWAIWLRSRMNQWEIFKKYRNCYFMLAERMTNEHALCKTCCVLPIAFSFPPLFFFPHSQFCWPIYTIDFAFGHCMNMNIHTRTTPTTTKPYAHTHARTQNESHLVVIVYCCMSSTWNAIKSTFVWTRHWNYCIEDRIQRVREGKKLPANTLFSWRCKQTINYI